MKKETKNEQTSKDFDVRVLTSLMKRDLSTELADRVRVWYADDENREQKDSVMEDLFFEMVDEETPDVSAYALLDRVKAQLGVDQSQEREVPAANIRKLSWRKKLVRVAAIVVPTVMIVGAILYYSGNNSTIVTPPEKTMLVFSSDTDKYILLPDSSEVWLGDNTTISYDRDFLEKRVVNIKGEGYFSVARRDGMTFNVVSDKLNVQVLGTEFNVVDRVDGNEVSITLITGKVAVDVNGSNMEMKPLDRIKYDAQTGQTNIDQVTFDEVKLLQSDNLIRFDSTPLDEVFRRIGQYYEVDIQVEGNFGKDRLIRVEFLRGDLLDEVLSVVRATSENSFTYTIIDNRVVITSR